MRFRFFHKLLLGFAPVGIMTVMIAFLALSIIRSNNMEIKLIVEQQVEPLAEIALLQGEANSIRKNEAELTKITDYFALTGNIESLLLNLNNFEQRFYAFLESPNISANNAATLKTAWNLYRQDLDRTISYSNNGELGKAQNVSVFSSSPRFTIFAENLDELIQLIQGKANDVYMESVSKLEYRQKIFLLLSLSTFFLTVVLAWFYAKTLARRVDFLKSEANRLAQGDLNNPIRLQGGDEISQLALSLDGMRMNLKKRELDLQESQALLEARVVERTKKYNESNIQLKSQINERIRAETALRESQERLLKAQRIAGLGSWELNIQNMSIQFSSNLRKILCLEEKSLPADLTEIINRFIPTEDREQTKNLIDSIRTKDEIPPNECRIILPSGQIRHIWIEGELLYNEHQELQRIIGTVQDITERKQMEEQLLRSQRIDSIGQLASGIAHDFNNLLTSIVGNLHLLEIAVEEKKRAYHIDEISKATSRAMELAGKLLTFAKGGIPLTETLVLDSQIREIAKIALTGTSIVPRIEIDSDLMPVDIDRSQIGQVFQNLIINARDAMPNGGNLSITARNVVLPPVNPLSLPSGQYNEISIADTGIGIKEDDLPHIFDLYFSRKERGADRGTGLGLAICHSIIKKHNGDILVKSSVGTGTAFTFYLPASIHAPLDTSIQEKVVEKGKGRILVMDDEQIIQDVIRELLRSLGYRVEITNNGEEAITAYQNALATADRFDAVILDLTIRGGMGGFETVRRLKELDPEVTALVSSGYSDNTNLKDYHKHGFIAAIPKPYNIVELSRTLKALIT